MAGVQVSIERKYSFLHCTEKENLHESYSELQTSLTSAYIKFKDSPTLSNKETYLSHKAAFDALLTQIESKYTFLAISKFHIFGNQSGKLLSNLLKGQHPPTIIKCLRGADGKPTAKGDEISAILHSFYTHRVDPEVPVSYRPITLLNSDYKLYTNILADRLKVILRHIIHDDQSGFIPGRHSVTNVYKVQCSGWSNTI